MKKLKIAIIGSRGYPYIYSGYETLVKELSERLIKKGHNVRVYCHRSLFVNKPKNVNGIELVYTPSINSKIFSQFFNSFFSFIHVCFSKVDIILVVNSANGPFGILTKIFRKKTCINVDGLEWLRPKWKGFGSIYYKYASKLSTILFDKIITDSEEMSDIYLEKFNSLSSVIAYGSTMVNTKSIDVLKKFNLHKNQFYLIVGRLIPDNNSKLIIESFIRSNNNKKLVVVGDVPYIDKYADDIKKIKSEKLILTGYIKCQNQLTQLFANCFAYIHGHEFGGTNPTMINALDMNCEIISLDTVFNREMLKNKKVIFFKKKIFSITNSIKLFESSHHELIKINKKYKLPEKYRWNFIVQKYIDEFLKVTNYQNK